MKKIILMHESEQRNVFADHARMAKAALPDWELVVWDGRPPDLTDATVLKVGNTFYLGTEQFEALGDELSKAAMVFVTINDYTSPPPTQVRDALRPINGRVCVLTTIDPSVLSARTAGRRMWDWFTGVQTVDWNKASWSRVAVRHASYAQGIIYWGALRQARVPSFKRFLTGAPYPVTLSGATRSKGAWAELVPNADWAGRLSIDDATAWQATIYMEDENQHEEFHSVAARFYEAVSRGQLVLADEKCWKTFQQGDLNMNPWLVEDAGAVARMLRNAGRERARQQGAFGLDYFAIGAKQLKSVIRRYVK